MRRGKRDRCTARLCTATPSGSSPRKRANHQDLAFAVAKLGVLDDASFDTTAQYIPGKAWFWRAHERPAAGSVLAASRGSEGKSAAAASSMPARPMHTVCANYTAAPDPFIARFLHVEKAPKSPDKHSPQLRNVKFFQKSLAYFFGKGRKPRRQ